MMFGSKTSFKSRVKNLSLQITHTNWQVENSMVTCRSCETENRQDSKYCRACGCLLCFDISEYTTPDPTESYAKIKNVEKTWNENDAHNLKTIKSGGTPEQEKDEKLQRFVSNFHLTPLLPGELLFLEKYEIIKCLNTEPENNEYYARENKLFVTCPHCNLKSSQNLDYCQDCGADLEEVNTESIFVRIKENTDCRSFELEQEIICQDLSNGPFSGLLDVFSLKTSKKTEIYYSVWLDDPTATHLNEADLNQPLDRLIGWSIDLCEVLNFLHQRGVIYPDIFNNSVICNDLSLKIRFLDHRFITSSKESFNSEIETVDNIWGNSLFTSDYQYILRCILHDMEKDPEVKSIARFYWYSSVSGENDCNNPSNRELGLTLLAVREQERKSTAIVPNVSIPGELEFLRGLKLDINNLILEITRLLKPTSNLSKYSKLDQLLSRFLAELEKGYESLITTGIIVDKLREILTHANIPVAISLESHALSDVGLVRELNYDSVFVIEKTIISNAKSCYCGLYVVADGMGGHDAGEIASRMAITSVSKYVWEHLFDLDLIDYDSEMLPEIMEQSFIEANRNIFLEAQNIGNDMGTTLTGTLIVGNDVCFANVGDSMGGLIRDGVMHFQTTPHSYVQSLVDAGNITIDEARLHPQRNVIHRSIGTNETVEVDTYMCELSPGDLLLICSDGLSDMLPDGEILKVLINESTITKASNKLIELANEAGGDDNISIVLVRSVNSAKYD